MRPRRLGRLGTQSVKLLLQLLELFVGQLLEIDQLVARALESANELVELDVNRDRVPVLRVLDQEHHEKGDDRRAGIDDELPRIGKVEDGSGDGPPEDDQNREDEGPGRPHTARRQVGELTERSRGEVLKVREVHSTLAKHRRGYQLVG